MAALLTVTWLLVVSLTSADLVYYVTPNYSHEHSCLSCHNLSYYISNPESYFTSGTTIIFLEGQHSFDREDLVYVSNVHNLTLKGQGQWPVAGPEETVMQSTVIINCTRGRGGFRFDASDSITIEGLTIVNCGGFDNKVVFSFDNVKNLVFYKNSIQHMKGYGIFVRNCDNVRITNCSYYHSTLCYHSYQLGGGVGIEYNGTDSYSLDLSYSNMTKCCSKYYPGGGGVSLSAQSGFRQVTVLLDHLVLSQNSAHFGGGLAASIDGKGNVTLNISSCLFFRGFASEVSGGIYIDSRDAASAITIQNSKLIENSNFEVSELSYRSSRTMLTTLALLNSTFLHTETHSQYGIRIDGCCPNVTLDNTKMIFTKQNNSGVFILTNEHYDISLLINDCLFEKSQSGTAILYIDNTRSLITNSKFSGNTGDHSVIVIDCNSNNYNICGTIANSSISDNNITGITIVERMILHFKGRNVIRNNSNTDGGGIVLPNIAHILVEGELVLYNNTADKYGGAILVQTLLKQIIHAIHCTLDFYDDYSSVIFSGNRAGRGGSDMYGGTLMGCVNGKGLNEHHVGRSNEISYYFDTPLMKYLNFSNTDKFSSLSSDPIMVCFCDDDNMPDCSDRTQHHIQTYPGLEINTSIATVGYYGGTSPGDVLVSDQDAKQFRYYGQNSNTSCFQLHILLQNTSSTTALVDIRVDGGLQGWGVSLAVDIVECPIGFTLILGQCQCEQFLHVNNVKCNLSSTIFKFLRSGNSWFALMNKTQCITGATVCPFDYCNQSSISFDIMAPDRQCMGNRAGILCGQCQSHLSIMLGSNNCGTCSNWYLFLLPVFALAGIVLVAVLMFLNLSVSVGTINGLLFYANMVKLNEAFFFPNGSVPVVSQFISWLNLDLGIEVCLFDGLDGYWNTWLQFVFPAYLFLLMGCIIVGSHYSVWLCRLCGSHAVPALATLFLMSYTKILLTVTNALSMSQLPCNDSILTVWSVDGNIEYGSGKHLILLIFSCGVLVIGLAYPIIVLCAPLLERYSHRCISYKWNPVLNFKPLLDAYGGPYKDKYRFWTGVTLMVRLMVTVSFSFTSGKWVIINSYIITTIVVGIFILWSFTKGVYTKTYLSAIEAFYLLNIFLLSTVSLAAASLGSKDYQISTITFSACLSILACLFTMAMHLCWKFDFKMIKKRLRFNNRPVELAVPQVTENKDEEDRLLGSPPSVVYGSYRGENKFVLEFPHRNDKRSSPVLLTREPLLFDV